MTVGLSPPAKGRFGGTAAVTTNASGTAVFTNLSITGLVGARTLSFSATGLTGVTSGTVNVTAGTATKLALTTQPSSLSAERIAFPQQPSDPAARRFPEPGKSERTSVSAAIATGGGTLGGTTAVTTNASGTAVFTNLAITGTVGRVRPAFSAPGAYG